ncbi:MAG: hypothetical protein DMF90_11145 [Acidobacteria bacterium]|nr:MAG: hypothetical protein DMF90_11145 [Acidobacteriota bacterium]
MSRHDEVERDRDISDESIEREDFRMKRITSGRVRLASLLVGLLVAPWIWLQAQQPARGPVPIDSDDIGGVVTGPKGPEAGVWVVAETRSLPTGFARMVVTDDQGRYVLPDLPRGEYDVFVRGYGLIDSPRQKSKPGQQLNLTAQPAPNPAAAAQYYPAAYWAGMMDKPISAGCLACHEIGNKATREIPASITKAASSSLEAWDRRTAMGPEGGGMFASFKRLGADRQVFADWTDRVAKGELPRQTPPRPVGVERNLVVSWWDWGTKVDGRTDAAASDTRNATINADGKVYMVSRSDDVMAVLDPVEHRAQVVKIPSSAPFVADKSPRSAYWGEEAIWKRQAEPRSVALDDRGRVWLTARLREKPGLPAFCTSDTNKFAKYYSAASRGGRGGGGAYGDIGRQLIMYDTKSQQFTPIPDTCFTLDHNQLGPDNYLYFGSNNVVFWLDTATWEKTKNTEASQGWCPAVVDTNGDGKITEWTEADAPPDPKKDQRLNFGCYMVAVDPLNKNGVAWCGDNGRLTRVERGSNPPQTCKAEMYKPPTGHTPEVTGDGHAAVDEQGVVWMNWRGSQHLTAFDRRKCKVTNGPLAATGQACPEGWSVYLKDAPTYAGTNIQSHMTYLSQIDRHDTLGLGRNLPVYGTVNTDMLVAFRPDRREFVSLVVPYPMGFFSRSANGRIDDPKAGWKGKGLWSSFSTYIPWHVEGGMEGHGSKAVKFQMRPDPLAK